MGVEYYAICREKREYVCLGKIIPHMSGSPMSWSEFIHDEFDCANWSRPHRVYALYLLLNFVLRNQGGTIEVMRDNDFIDWKLSLRPEKVKEVFEEPGSVVELTEPERSKLEKVWYHGWGDSCQ